MFFDQSDIEQIELLCTKAEKNVISLERLKSLAFAAKNGYGQDGFEINGHMTISLSNNIEATLTIEEQPPGLMRHLSVSTRLAGDLPDPEMIEELLVHFSFRHSLEECHVYPEFFGNQGQIAINILEPKDSSWKNFLDKQT